MQNFLKIYFQTSLSVALIWNFRLNLKFETNESSKTNTLFGNILIFCPAERFCFYLIWTNHDGQTLSSEANAKLWMQNSPEVNEAGVTTIFEYQLFPCHIWLLFNNYQLDNALYLSLFVFLSSFSPKFFFFFISFFFLLFPF